MCGRYPQSKKARDHARLLAEREALSPRRSESWNVAPTTESLVVLNDSKGLVRDWLVWGYQDHDQVPKFFNARLETAADKRTFRDAWPNHRCVVPSDGWFEWKTERGRKQPYYFYTRDGGPIFLAGLWQHRTFLLLTMDAGALTPYHDRRPVSLGVEEAKAWIDGNPVAWKDVARAALPDTGFAVHPVSPRVNKSGTDGPDLIAPVRLDAFPATPEQISLL